MDIYNQNSSNHNNSQSTNNHQGTHADTSIGEAFSISMNHKS